MDEVRLQKFLAEAGVASRRKAEELIKQGRVSVNGVKIIEMGTKVTDRDLVEVDGKKIKFEEKKVYIILNKPSGYVTTVKDQFQRPAVLDLVKDIKERVYPVGRLDYDTSGLILLTNDGEFTFRLTHPKHEMKKVYVAEVRGIPTAEELKKFEEGIEIEDYKTAPAQIKILKKADNKATVEITIHEGKNRQIRKMCEGIGHPVALLKRVEIAGVQLGTLAEGKWRNLNSAEVKILNTQVKSLKK